VNLLNLLAQTSKTPQRLAIRRIPGVSGTLDAVVFAAKSFLFIN
jgi:hypothetical protein